MALTTETGEDELWIPWEVGSVLTTETGLGEL